jgi:hypothetical protein
MPFMMRSLIMYNCIRVDVHTLLQLLPPFLNYYHWLVFTALLCKRDHYLICLLPYISRWNAIPFMSWLWVLFSLCCMWNMVMKIINQLVLLIYKMFSAKRIRTLLVMPKEFLLKSVTGWFLLDKVLDSFGSLYVFSRRCAMVHMSI